jgi:hypothetical protein
VLLVVVLLLQQQGRQVRVLLCHQRQLGEQWQCIRLVQ